MTVITVIGGGSSMFVPGVVRRLLELEPFESAQLRLMDIDERRLEVMAALARELNSAERRGLTISTYTDQRAALTAADFVIVAISVGGMAAWESDIEIPAKHGVFMHIADSVGPGGIFRALRNLPVIASVAQDVADVAPDAYVFNYTNPASANAIAMASSASIKSFSLCSCSPLPYMDSWLAEMVGVPAAQIVKPLNVGGINHCTGIMDLRLTDGTNAMPLVRERAFDDITRWAIDHFEVIPYCWDHWCEFFPSLQRLETSYTGRAQGLTMRYGRPIKDMDVQQQRMVRWESLAKEWQRSPGEHRLEDLPPGPEDDGIVVVEIMAAILSGRRERFIINTINTDGLIPNLPREAAVEVPAEVSADGIKPIALPALPEALAGVLSRHASVQLVTARAAMTGDRRMLDSAMATDPMCEATLEPLQILALTEEMLAANAPLLTSLAGQRLLAGRSTVSR